jgi:hypothetical protein
MSITKLVIVLVIIGIASMGAYKLIQDDQISSSSTKTAVLYKSPTCGCCTKYTGYLKSQGYDVEVVKTNDMQSIKDQYGIPHNMESCHTTIIEGYAIEGHIPIEGINYLLTQRPDLDGIALPGMPSGSPGMPGSKFEPFQIFALQDGQASNLINL